MRATPTQSRLPRSLSLLSMAIGLSLLAAGCGNEIPVGAVSKAQARQNGGTDSDGNDLCQQAGWYSDNECDDFCPQPDPDCQPVNCLAAPVCDDGDVEVGGGQSACPQDATCYSRSICGTTIWCTPDQGVQCEAYPACNEGDTEVKSEGDCPQDASCYQASICGYSIWCTGGGKVNCEAYPTCQAEDSEVPSQADCPAGNERCYEASICGYSIWCTGPALSTCQAYPSCDEGDSEVASQGACLQDNARCYQRSLCSYDIWCTGPGNATCAGENPAGCTTNSDCAAGQVCQAGGANDCRSSSCSCDPKTASWTCTADCGGGACVPAP